MGENKENVSKILEDINEDNISTFSTKTRRRELKFGKIVAELKFPTQFFGLFNVRYSPSGNDVMTCFGQGAIQVRHPENGELKRTIRSGGNHSYPVQCLRFNPVHQNKCYAASSCGNIFLCDLERYDYSIFATEYRNELNTVDVSYDGTLVATGGKDTKLRIYDTHTNKLVMSYGREIGMYNRKISGAERLHHVMRIYCIRFSPRFGNILMSGGWDDTILIWDMRDDTGCVRKIYGPHICGDAIDIRDKTLLTGSWTVRKSLQLWDFGSGELIDTIVPGNRPTNMNGEFLYSCQFFNGDASEDLVVCGGSGTGYVEVISLKQKRVLDSYKCPKPCQTLDSFQNNIIYGGMESCFRIVDFNSKSVFRN